MNITARCGLTLDVEVTYEQLRALRFNDMTPIEFQEKHDRIDSTSHIIGDDRVILAVRLSAGDRITFVGDVKLPGVTRVPATAPRFMDVHRPLTHDVLMLPDQTLTVNGMPAAAWNAECVLAGVNGVVFGPRLTDTGNVIWRLNLRPKDRVRIE